MKLINYIFIGFFAAIGIVAIIGIIMGEYHQAVGVVIAAVIIGGLAYDNKKEAIK